jgi:hypothetical protein
MRVIFMKMHLLCLAAWLAMLLCPCAVCSQAAEPPVATMPDATLAWKKDTNFCALLSRERPSPWYALKLGTMCYLSPAVLGYQPCRLKAHASLTLRYRVAVHSGRWNPEQLRLASEQYLRAEDHR